MARPTIKDEETYKRLRETGDSKEKAARIANSSNRASRRGGKHPPYEDWSKDRLYGQAQKIGIAGRSKMTKSQLVEALRSH